VIPLSWPAVIGKIGQDINSPLTGEDHSKLQLSLHISEYQAVTNTATYYVAISSAVWPVIGVFLTVIAMSWSQIVAKWYGLPAVVWCSAAVIQTCLIAWAGMLSEQYNMVLYVERHLRPLVQEIVVTPFFWLYEPFNRAQRAKSRANLWWEMSVPYVMLLILFSAACYRAVHLREHTYFIDIIGILINSALLLRLFQMCRSVVETRRAWEASDRQVEAWLSESQVPKKDVSAPS
jgi:hypothetical protein